MGETRDLICERLMMSFSSHSRHNREVKLYHSIVTIILPSAGIAVISSKRLKAEKYYTFTPRPLGLTFWLSQEGEMEIWNLS